jgi:hypothetical protein
MLRDVEASCHRQARPRLPPAGPQLQWQAIVHHVAIADRDCCANHHHFTGKRDFRR